MSETWQPVLAENEFLEDGSLAVRVAGWHVLIARTENGFAALNDRCTHQAARLSGGRIRRGAVMCPLHGARFDVASGRCIGAAYRDLRTFPLRIAGGVIEVLVPDAPPGIDEIPVTV